MTPANCAIAKRDFTHITEGVAVDLRDHARDFPNKAACVLSHSGEVTTFAQLEASANQAARVFRGLGLGPGDVVAYLIDNDPRYFELAWAARRTGLYYVGLSTALTDGEIRYILEDCGARLLIHAATLQDVAMASVEGLSITRLGLDSADPEHSYDRLKLTQSTAPIEDEAPGQDLLYSSGTTGRPKGIKTPPAEGGLRKLMPMARMGADLYGMNADTVYLNPAPLYHAAPLRFTLAVQQLGGTVVLMQKFDAEQALAAIERYRITHSQWVPTHFVRMLKLSAETREKYNLSSLQCAIHAAAPCPVEIKQAMLDWWGPIVYEYYSSTELNGFTAVTPAEWLAHRGTVGRAIYGEFKICDENGEPLPPRSEGFIYVADGRPFEYLNDPVKTAESLNKYGWSTVGDIGWLDEEGYLYLTDRKGFVIISGGVNIYPQEIENLIIEHPAVADAAVFGVPDPDWGEKVAAVVELTDPHSAGDAVQVDLDVYLRARLGKIKVPKILEFVDKLPRSEAGKLAKKKIRQDFIKVRFDENQAN